MFYVTKSGVVVQKGSFLKKEAEKKKLKRIMPNPEIDIIVEVRDLDFEISNEERYYNWVEYCKKMILLESIHVEIKNSKETK